MTGCIQAAYLKAGQDFQVFSKLLPEILAYNNLPNIKIPPSWLGKQQPPSPPPTPNAPPPHPTSLLLQPHPQSPQPLNHKQLVATHHALTPTTTLQICLHANVEVPPPHQSGAQKPWPPPRHHQTDQGRPLRGPQ
ncbi:hypothetical protein Pcinc_014552 [Petrolisthes cinctipes]|uniref:Uncharacterized protein n=1 Tax=Petrolisthes cinctipes TaxID=88211 RepID=A0AAE1KRA6_PETCI|nr:hypothetical protein Pcinc_014552 [Petrolisthes cinctipes]